MRNSLVNFWRRLDMSTPPYAHPDDFFVLRRGNGRHIDEELRNFESFVASDRFGNLDDHRFHLSLLPVPYGGNLARAEIVILLLNPGFSYTDYYAEYHVPAFRRRLETNLRQSFKGVEFPFLWLDPEFCWHSGFSWWEGKLRKVIDVVARERFKGRYLDALRDMSRRLAHIELVPYHSPSFRSHALINNLSSSQAARQFVQDALVPAARIGTRTIILTRQQSVWGLPRNRKEIVIYAGGLTRGASLGPNSPGGRAILQRYGITVTR